MLKTIWDKPDIEFGWVLFDRCSVYFSCLAKTVARRSADRQIFFLMIFLDSFEYFLSSSDFSDFLFA